MAPTRDIVVRPVAPADHDAVWSILEPAIRAATTYAVPPDWSRDRTMQWWLSGPHQVFVATVAGTVSGTYYLRPNQAGPGSHVANCGYVTHPDHAGRDIATAMCRDSLDRARAQGFRAMQFNLVVSTNVRAVALWRSLGFAVVGTIPEGFHHPTAGYVDAYVMYRPL